MATYTAPQRTPGRRRSLSRRILIVLAAGFLVPASLLAIARAPVHAAPSNNPIFATIQDVQNAINAALAPIQSAIASLQQQQAAQATQISNLQNSTNFKPLLLDANGQTLGILAGSNLPYDTIYSTSLNKFIDIADNDYAEKQEFPTGIADVASPLYYQSSNCTGTPYFVNYIVYANHVLAFSPNEYYIFHSPEPMTTTTLGSIKYWNWQSNSPYCVPDPQNSFQGWQVYPVTLPFSTPISQPLQFKYQ